MKFKLLIVFILFSLLSVSQVAQDPTASFTYYDTNGKEISKRKFEKKRNTYKVLDIVLDSLKEKRLIERYEIGKLKNVNTVYKFLSSELNISLDTTQSLVIIYYPGVDRCNSSGNATKESNKKRFEKMEVKLKKFTSNSVLYMVKQNEPIFKTEVLVPWLYDPKGLIEKYFFKHHYPCKSYVVINPYGVYKSYFGEYDHDQAIEDVKLLSRKKYSENYKK